MEELNKNVISMSIMKYVSHISALIALFAEIYLLVLMPQAWDKHSIVFYSVMILAVILTTLTIIIIFSKEKRADFLLSFISAVHTHAGNIWGVLMIVFVLTQLHLIGTSFHEYLKSGHEGLEALIFLELMFLPFVFQAFFPVKNEKNEVPARDRKVLITGLSKNNKDDLIIALNENFNNKPYNWMPVVDMLAKYTEVNKILLLLSPEVKAELDTANSESGKDIFIELLGKKFSGRIIKPEIISVENVDDFDNMYKEVKPVINAKLNKYKSKEIMFGISPATSTVTATLVFLSMPGERGFVYKHQNDSGLQEFNVNAYDIKELWDEIFEVRVKQ
jgi:hypothetical protein